jgi:hypothetical protein
MCYNSGQEQPVVSKETIYRVSFVSQGEVYEIYARNVSQGGLFGFIEIEELVFGERSKLLIDSSEERLKTEFEGVRRTYVPLHSVLRVDEVEKAGRGRITSGEGKVATFPMAIMPHGKKGDS